MDINREHNLDYIIEHTAIVQMPKHLLSTFAVTDIDYHCVCPIDERTTRYHRGIIKAEKPAIIHPHMSSQMLEGFDTETQGLLDQMIEKLGVNLRILGYLFKNNPIHSSVEHMSVQSVIDRVCAEVKEKPRTAVIKGVDHVWQIGLIKLIMENAGRSFPSNVQELEERGFFPDSNGTPQRIRWNVDLLFKKAAENKNALNELGNFLKQHNLFRDYEDRFFSLIKKHNHI